MSPTLSSLHANTRLALVLLAALATAACGGPQPAASASDAPASASTGGAPASRSAPDGGAALTAAECKAAGGEVVGDIGDGAIHRPDYRCPRSGEAPLGPIAHDAGQPIAVEGAVCCR